MHTWEEHGVVEGYVIACSNLLAWEVHRGVANWGRFPLATQAFEPFLLKSGSLNVAGVAEGAVAGPVA